MGDVPSVLPTPKKITLEEWRQQQASRLPLEDARSSSSRTARQEERGEKRGRARSRGSASPSRRRRLDEMEDRRRDSDLRERERAGKSDYSIDAKGEGRDRGYDSRRPSDTVAGSRSLDGRERGRGMGWDRRGEAYVAQVEERPSRAKRDERGQERDSGYRRSLPEKRGESSSSYHIHPHPPTGPSKRGDALDSRDSRSPRRPRPGDDVPYDVAKEWTVIFIRGVPGLTGELVDGFGVLSKFCGRMPPVAIKPVQPQKAVAASTTTNRTVSAFMAFTNPEDAAAFRVAVNHARVDGGRMQAADSHPPQNRDRSLKRDGIWRWGFTSPEFLDAYHRWQLEDYQRRLDGLPALSMSHAPQIEPPRPPLHPAHKSAPFIKRPAPPSAGEEMPKAISDGFHQLYISELPMNVTTEEMRDYFSGAEGLIGIKLGTPTLAYNNNNAWVAFAEREQVHRVMAKLDGKYYANHRKPLYLEYAVGPKRRMYWAWEEMSKEFCRQHKLVLQPSHPNFVPVPPSPALTSDAHALGVTPALEQGAPHQIERQAGPHASSPEKGGAFVHPSRLALVDIKPVLPIVTPTVAADDEGDDEDDLIVVESSFRSRLPPPPPPRPPMTGANALVDKAATRTIEDAWGMRRRASQSRGGAEAGAAPSLGHDLSPDSNLADVSSFIQSAISGGSSTIPRQLYSSSFATPSLAPNMGLSQPLPPLYFNGHATTSQGATSSTPTASRTLDPRIPTGPRLLNIKGKGGAQSPPSKPALGVGSLAPQPPKMEAEKVGILNVAGEAEVARRRSVSTSASASASVEDGSPRKEGDGAGEVVAAASNAGSEGADEAACEGTVKVDEDVSGSGAEGAGESKDEVGAGAEQPVAVASPKESL